MSDSSNNSMETVSFRRFLSYIYAYEDDTKLRNVGFAKVEVRSQRVRFQVIVNGILQKGGRPLELCLVDGNLNRIPVGQVMLQNGRGEYRGSSNTEDLWDSGMAFSQIYGICLQGAGNKRHYYMTLWREVARPVRVARNQIVVIPRNREQENDTSQMVHAAEVKEELEEAEKAVEEISSKKAEILEKEIKPKEVKAFAEEIKSKETNVSEEEISSKEVEIFAEEADSKEAKVSAGEINSKEMNTSAGETGSKEVNVSAGEIGSKEVNVFAGEINSKEMNTSAGEIDSKEVNASAGEIDSKEMNVSAEKIGSKKAKVSTENVKLKETGVSSDEIQSEESERIKSAEAGISAEEEQSEESEKDLQDQLESASELIKQQSASESSGTGISGTMRQQSGRRGKKEDKRMELWKRFCSRYPHVDIRPDRMDESGVGNDFSEAGKICEVLRIRPNDIGRLPRNNWILAHNSFLQHAYNHSHQLILFRVENQESEADGENHWFIGLPGERSEQEMLVAEVFGFKKFMQCKNGGFWYTEIYMGVY